MTLSCKNFKSPLTTLLWRGLDQGHLHSLLLTRVARIAAEYFSKQLFEQLIILLLGTFTYVGRNLYNINLKHLKLLHKCLVNIFLIIFR
jgi:hypothetical protein